MVFLRHLRLARSLIVRKPSLANPRNSAPACSMRRCRGSPDSDSLFFASPKKSKQKKGDPQSGSRREATGNLRCSNPVGSRANSPAAQKGTSAQVLVELWRADRDGVQGVFLQPIAVLLAIKATQQTARDRAITGRKDLCRGSQAHPLIHWLLRSSAQPERGFCVSVRTEFQAPSGRICRYTYPASASGHKPGK